MEEVFEVLQGKFDGLPTMDRNLIALASLEAIAKVIAKEVHTHAMILGHNRNMAEKRILEYSKLFKMVASNHLDNL